MAESWVVLSVRVPLEVKQRLEEHAHRKNFPNIGSLHRAIIWNYALSDDEETDAVDASNTRDLRPSNDCACPLMTFARYELYKRCPFRKAPPDAK